MRVAKRDVPVIQACGLVFAAVFVTLNTVADILAILVNPRLRQPPVEGTHDDLRTSSSPLTAKIGLGIVAFYLLLAIFGPWIAPYGESQSVGDTWAPFSCADAGSAPTRSAATC